MPLVSPSSALQEIQAWYLLFEEQYLQNSEGNPIQRSTAGSVVAIISASRAAERMPGKNGIQVGRTDRTAHPGWFVGRGAWNIFSQKQMSYSDY